MRIYTAEADTLDRPWIVAAWPGLTRERFTELVKAHLLDEGVPNEDVSVQRLTLCDWPYDEASAWLDGLAPVEGLTWPAMLERSAYLDLRWTYPGQWIELGVGEQEPIPAEFSRLSDFDSSEGYEPSDPKHPAFHDTYSDAWDNREKGVVA